MNQNYFRLRIFVLSLLLLTGVFSIAQISEGGLPASFMHQNLREQFNNFDFQKPDLEQINIEDQINAESQYPGPERMGVGVPVNLDLLASATREELPDGSSIWRMKISVPDALALGVYYSKFYIPAGGKLTVWCHAMI